MRLADPSSGENAMADKAEYIRSRKAELEDLKSERMSAAATMASAEQAKALDDLDRKIFALEREIAERTQNSQ
jgi:hypothetical protein